MKPTIVPASSVTGTLGLMIANVLIWGLGLAGISVPAETALNIAGILIILIMHFTKDQPPPEEIKEIVDDLSAKKE